MDFKSSLTKQLVKWGKKKEKRKKWGSEGGGKGGKKLALTFTGFNEALAEKKKKPDGKTETNPWAEYADFMIVMVGDGRGERDSKSRRVKG